MMAAIMSWRVLIPVLAALFLGSTLWLQQRQISHQRELLQAQQLATAQSQAALQALGDMGKRLHQQTQELLQAQQRVQSSLATRQTEIRRLQTDVNEIRTWADQPLPVDIQRVLQHPAANGAGDYGAAVPVGDPLHNVRVQPQDKR